MAPLTHIAVMGSGYVGLVTGTCFARLGHTVACVDIDGEKVRRLTRGDLPIYEPGLELLVREGLDAGRLSFTTEAAEAVPQSEFVFMAVQTPSASNGEADLDALLAAVRTITPMLADDAIMVQKSTVPIGTAGLVEGVLASGNGSSHRVVANPEFLREGTAIRDFLNPDRVVLGSSTHAAAVRVAQLYDFADCPVLITDASTAEMIKYASNSFLAAKISFINEIAGICEAFGLDVRRVVDGMGHDPRIGSQFLGPGLGWGGSCFPKDVKALIHMAKAADVSPRILQAVQRVNADQPRLAVRKLQESLGELEGTVVGLLGLSFKPGTDDLRHAPSLQLIEVLTEQRVSLRAYDPVAMDRARSLAPEVTFCDDPYTAAEGADALVLVTEWPQFLELDMLAIKQRMRRPVIVDGRNFLDGVALQSLGFTYRAFGLPSTPVEGPTDLAALAALEGMD